MYIYGSVYKYMYICINIRICINMCICIYICRYYTITDVCTTALLPTKPLSDDDSGFWHGFGAEASLPIGQSDTTTLSDCRHSMGLPYPPRYIYIYIYTFIYIYIYIYIYKYIYIFISIYIYISIFIYLYI